MKARYLLAVVSLAIVLGVCPAGAETGRVVLVHGGPGDAVSAHLVDELVALGMTVEIAPFGEADLSSLARARSARAALRVSPSRRVIELWTFGASAPEEISEQRTEHGDAAAFALRAVELLRGRLLSAEAPDHPPTNPVPDKPLTEPPPKDEPAKTNDTTAPNEIVPKNPAREHLASRRRASARRPAWLTLHLEPAAIVQPLSGGISAAGMLVVGARLMPSPRFGADVFGLVPFLSSSLASPEGRVYLTAAALFIGGCAELTDPRGPLGVNVGAGMGGGLLHFTGQPQSPRVEARDGTVAFASPYARLGFVWRALPNLGLRADMIGAMTTPRPVLRIPGRPSDAYFGRPLIGIGLGLEVTLR